MASQDMDDVRAKLNGIRACETTEDLADATARTIDALLAYIEQLEARVKKAEKLAKIM